VGKHFSQLKLQGLNFVYDVVVRRWALRGWMEICN